MGAGTDRRTFLKVAAMAAAAAALTSPTTAFVRECESSVPGDDGMTWNKAPCRFCGTGCHVQVGVKDGRVMAIAGDPKADVNKGLLCVKGYHVGMALYGKDRLTEPLLRKGDGYVPISWDEAIDVWAKRVMKAPERFAIYGSGQWTIPEGFAAQKLMKGGLGNNHIDPNARLCMASAVTGFIGTYGVDGPAGCYADLDACDVLITWGNNPAEMHPVLWSRVIDRRSRGETVKIIDIGTRRTRTTLQADEYLEMLPHGDVAIALGILNRLRHHETWNKEFVSRHCNFRAHPEGKFTLKGVPIDFDTWTQRIAKYTPEYVEKLSGIPAEKIEMVAALFADRKIKITSLWCMGMNQHTMGTAINTLVHGVHLFSGHFGTPGDSPMSLTGQPSACGTVREVGTLAHALPGGRLVANETHRRQCEDFWNVPRDRIHPKPGYHTVTMWEQFTKPAAEGGDIDTIFVQVTNPGQTLPNLNHLFNDKKGLAEKFMVVSEVYPTATTRLADLILPAAMWVEKNGVYGNSERRTQQWFKMIEPPGQARDDTWMTIALAHRLMELGHPGMKDKDGNFLFRVTDENGKEVPIWKWEHYYDVNVDKALLEEYRPFTRMKHKDIAPYDEYVKARGLRWPVVQQKDGTWRETRFRFSGFDDPYVKEGQDLEFYHSTTGDGRAQIWFHDYIPPPEMPDDEYPMWLCTGRVLEHWHSGTMTRRVKPLASAMPTAYVEVHPDDARKLGVRNGELVIVESRRGATELPVWTNGRGQPPKGTIFVPFFDETRRINDVTLHLFCPVSKQPDYKKCAARIRKKGH